MSGISSAFKYSVKNTKRVILYVTVFMMAITLVSPLVNNNQASAAAPYSQMSLDDLNKSTSYYVTLQTCVSNNMKGTITADSASYGPSQIDWFDDNQAWGYIYPEGKTDCKDIMSKALSLWNVSPETFLKGMGYSQKSKTSYNWSGTADGGTRKANFISYVKTAAVTNDSDPANPGGAAAYQRYDYWWDNNCVVKKFGEYSKITDSVIKAKIDKGETTAVIDGSSTTTEKYAAVARVDGVKWGYLYNDKSTYTSGTGGSSSSDFNYIAYGYHTTPRMITCADTAKALTQYANDYEAYLNKEAVSQACQTKGYSGATLAACINGKLSSDPTYCSTYTGELLAACKAGLNLSDKELSDAKSVVSQQENVDSDGGDSDGGTTATSCGVEGLGWIICPVVSLMSDTLQDIFKGLSDNFLKLDVSLFSTGSGTYLGWNAFRSVANVAFVIVFLIIIFSQLTGAGVSNYGVKKMLPRLVIAAILVNVSFFVCQLAADLSNVLGVSLKSVFDGIANNIGVPNSTDASSNGFGIAAITTAIIGAAIISYFALGILIPVLLGALLAALMIILILILRKAIIVLLIVISPLAFVAFLLPNTENLFTKWRKMFMSMLLLFPIVSIVFGASSLASQILLHADPGNMTVKITAIAAATLPFFVVPALLKSSLDAVGNLGGKINGIGSKMGGNLGKTSSKLFDNTALARGREIRRHGRAAYRNEKFARDITKTDSEGKRVKTLRSRMAQGFNFTEAQRHANAALDRTASATAEKAEMQEVEAAEVLMRSTHTDPSTLISKASSELGDAIKLNDGVKARAAQNILLNSGNKGISELESRLTDSFDKKGKSKTDPVGNSLRTSLNRAGLKGKNNVLASWAFNDKNIEETANDTDTLGKLSDSELANHSRENLVRAHNKGILTAERAQQMLSSPVVMSSMGQNERIYVQSIASGTTENQTSSSSNSAQPGQPTTPQAVQPTINQSTPSPQTQVPPQGSSTPGGVIVPDDNNFNVPH